jgi:hypothetical protein
VEAPCVVRSKIDFDTAFPRDLKAGEIAYLYWVEDSYRGDCFWLHLISLEHPAKEYTLMFNVGQKPERWLEVLA